MPPLFHDPPWQLRSFLSPYFYDTALLGQKTLTDLVSFLSLLPRTSFHMTEGFFFLKVFPPVCLFQFFQLCLPWVFQAFSYSRPCVSPAFLITFLLFFFLCTDSFSWLSHELMVQPLLCVPRLPLAYFKPEDSFTYIRGPQTPGSDA